MDLKHLGYFVQVAELGSFTRAAEKLFRTQPAVSMAIQRLEAELGETLIDRSGRELTLTDAGRLVYDCARQQENLHRGLLNQLTELRNKAAGRLVIGEETVKTHLSSIYRKLGVSDRTSAAATALREGIFR